MPLDKSSTCHFTVKHSGRRAKWGSPVLESGGRRELLETCDYTSGKWDFDNISHPLYNESDCPYMSDQVACQKYGRSDLDYQYWRWQPHNCNLKRYLLFFLFVSCSDLPTILRLRRNCCYYIFYGLELLILVPCYAVSSFLLILLINS